MNLESPLPKSFPHEKVWKCGPASEERDPEPGGGGRESCLRTITEKRTE